MVMTIEETSTAFFEIYRSLMAECEDVMGVDRELPPGVSIKSYGKLYELPVQQLAAFLFQQAGLLEAAKEAAAKPNKDTAILEMARDAEPEFEVEPSQALATVVALLVLFVNLESMKLWSMPISGLFDRVARGDDDAVFQAIILDAAVITAKPIANRIATASFYDDRPFFHRLSQAITRTKPVRPKPHLDETRVLMELLDEAGELEGMSDADLTNLAVNALEILPGLGDPQSSIRDQRRKRQRTKGGPRR